MVWPLRTCSLFTEGIDVRILQRPLLLQLLQK